MWNITCTIERIDLAIEELTQLYENEPYIDILAAINSLKKAKAAISEYIKEKEENEKDQ